MTNELKPCPFCGGTNLKVSGGSWKYVKCKDCDNGAHAPGQGSTGNEDDAISAWNTRNQRTCHYFPDEIQIAFDEDDNEIETGEAYSDGCDYSCDKCGYTMLGGDEGGWFEETPGEYGGWEFKPRFKFCPNCGSKLVDV